MLILSYVFGIGAMVSMFLIYQQKQRKNLLFVKLSADVTISLRTKTLFI